MSRLLSLSLPQSFPILLGPLFSILIALASDLPPNSLTITPYCSSSLLPPTSSSPLHPITPQSPLLLHYSTLVSQFFTHQVSHTSVLLHLPQSRKSSAMTEPGSSVQSLLSVSVTQSASPVLSLSLSNPKASLATCLEKLIFNSSLFPPDCLKSGICLPSSTILCSISTSPL